MEQRISLITLGTHDLAKSTAFFERLGWQRSLRQASGVAFFQCGGLAFSLYPVADLARDAGVPAEGGGFAGFALAYNTRSQDEVDQVLAAAVAAGARLVKPAQPAFWGGYHGYFADLDGYLWEIAWNPAFPLGADGAVRLPD